jgi:hypothetical protein
LQQTFARTKPLKSKGAAAVAKVLIYATMAARQAASLLSSSVAV